MSHTLSQRQLLILFVLFLVAVLIASAMAYSLIHTQLLHVLAGALVPGPHAPQAPGPHVVAKALVPGPHALQAPGPH